MGESVSYRLFFEKYTADVAFGLEFIDWTVIRLKI